MHVDLFYDHYFNFLSVKNDISKNELNKFRGQKLLKDKYLLHDPQCGWIILSLMSFEHKCFEATPSYYSIMVFL